MKKIIFIVTFFLILALYNYQFFLGSNPVKEVSLEADLTYANEKYLDKTMKSLVGLEMYDIDLRGLKILIENQPWIKNAQIILNPPKNITIKIIEHKAMYLWNNKKYVNYDGDFFITPNLPIDNILKISSNQYSHKHMHGLYMSINEILLDLDIEITSLHNKNSMIFIKSKNLNIVSRYSNHQSRLEEFVSVYDQFQATYKSKKPVNVDLRYPTGFAVH